MPKNNDAREVTFEIVEEIGVISTSGTGWKKELNIVAWNGNQGKYDIREWSPQHDRMSRGITLNEQEMRSIVELLKRRARYVPKGRVTMPQQSGSLAQDAGELLSQAEPMAQKEAEPAFAPAEGSAYTAAEDSAFAAAEGPEMTESEDPLMTAAEDSLMSADEDEPQEDDTFVPRAMEEAQQQAASF